MLTQPSIVELTDVTIKHDVVTDVMIKHDVVSVKMMFKNKILCLKQKFW